MAPTCSRRDATGRAAIRCQTSGERRRPAGPSRLPVGHLLHPWSRGVGTGPNRRAPWPDSESNWAVVDTLVGRVGQLPEPWTLASRLDSKPKLRPDRGSLGPGPWDGGRAAGTCLSRWFQTFPFRPDHARSPLYFTAGPHVMPLIPCLHMSHPISHLISPAKQFPLFTVFYRGDTAHPSSSGDVVLLAVFNWPLRRTCCRSLKGSAPQSGSVTTTLFSSAETLINCGSCSYHVSVIGDCVRVCGWSWGKGSRPGR